MSRTSYFALGDHNLVCDRCGLKIKASKARKTWDGYYVCARHWEPRNPLDFQKGAKDNQSVPFTRSRTEAVIPVRTSAYLILAADDTVFTDATAAPFSVTLPAAPTLMERHFIRKLDKTNNAVTINGNGHTVQMNVLTEPDSGVVLQFNSIWYVSDTYPSRG